MTDDDSVDVNPDTEPDDQSPLGEEWEMNWPDEMNSQDRVEAIAKTVRQPRSADWIAERADVTPKTARKHLKRFEEQDEFVTTRSEETGAMQYAPNPKQQFLDGVLELAERSEEELTELRKEISNNIEEWKGEFGVESPEDLRKTMDESMSTEERRRRRRIAHRWESRKYLQSKTNIAMEFRRHFNEFGYEINAGRGVLYENGDG